MINLIPPAARKGVVREYWLRVVSVWLFLFGTGCLIVAVLLLPTYMIVHGQIQNLDGQVSAASEKSATFDVSATELINASGQAALLASTASSTNFSHYLQLLESLSGGGVTLSTVTYLKDAAGGGKITISGIASTRQVLAGFRDTLEAAPEFSSVVLPIASLIKDKDLLFSMDISLAATTP